MSELLCGKSTKVAMARELKHLAIDYFNWDGEKGEEGREILQTLGTDIIREKLNNPLFHAKRVAETIGVIQDYFDYIFVPDIRFENEYYYLKTLYGEKVIMVKVERIDDNKDDNLTPIQHLHKSELGMDKFEHYDYTIKSASGLDNLRTAVKEEMRDFLRCQLKIK